MSSSFSENNLAISGLACERNDRLLFDNLTVNVRSGSMLLVRGMNGAGKSSLLRIIAGLLTPAQGNVFWNGQLIQQNYEWYTANLIYMGHQNGLRMRLSIVENFKNWSCFPSNDRQKDYLVELGLKKELNTPVYQLSAGQQRKAALMRLLYQQVPIWILDESFTAVDDKGRRMFLPVLHSHLMNNGLIIASCHEDIEIDSKYKTYLDLESN